MNQKICKTKTFHILKTKIKIRNIFQNKKII